MADNTKIEWTDATWNPITGCSVTSPGCTNCYAMQLAGTRLKHSPSRKGLTQPSKAGPVWTGEVRFNDHELLKPLRWKRPRMIFVCAHGDLFHESVCDAWIDKVFAVMALSPQHTFQVLTKRSGRMRRYVNGFTCDGARRYHVTQASIAMEEEGLTNDFFVDCAWPLPNVWLGVSVEDQQRADERIPDLLATPAAVRWISAEPLLGPVDAHDFLFPVGEGSRGTPSGLLVPVSVRPGLDWVVAGGESGQNARPMHPEWARALRDQCAAAGVPFFFKQWGEWVPYDEDHHDDTPLDPAGFVSPGNRSAVFWPDASGPTMMIPAGKKRAGRLLDGVLHDGMPA